MTEEEERVEDQARIQRACIGVGNAVCKPLAIVGGSLAVIILSLVLMEKTGCISFENKKSRPPVPAKVGAQDSSTLEIK